MDGFNPALSSAAGIALSDASAVEGWVKSSAPTI